MAAIVRATLLLLIIAFPASAELRTLALYTGPTNGLDPAALRTARTELQRLLAPTGVETTWRNLARIKFDERFNYVVVVSFTGACTVDELPYRVLTSGTLGDSSISDGKVLPFLRIDCGQLMRLMDLAVREMTMHERNTALGVALARVIAHEIYHILAQTISHQERGVGKASFTTQDLTAKGFEFDIFSVLLMRPASSAVLTESSGR